MSDLTDETKPNLENHVSEVAKELAKKLDYELRAAWRLGYNYVHVYDDIPLHSPTESGGTEQFTVSFRTFKAYSKEPIRPDGLVYRETYDLTDVSDAEVRAAIRKSNP